MQREPVARERLADLLLDRAPASQPALHGSGEHLDPIAPCLLGRIQRDIGALEQAVRIAAVVAGQRQSDRRGAHRSDRLGVGLAQLIEHAGAECFRLAAAGDLRHEDQLVASEPGHGVTGARRPDQPPARLDDDGVTAGVAVGVVDGFEVVEVDQVDGDCAAAALQPLDRRGQAVGQQRPVGEPGEPVTQRQLFELLLRRVALGDIAGRGEELVARSRGRPLARCGIGMALQVVSSQRHDPLPCRKR